MPRLGLNASLLCFISLASVSAIEAQDLPTLLSRFEAEHDRAAKEAILFDIEIGYPNAGPTILRLARETDDTDTKWLAIRGIGSLRFKPAALFLRQSLHSNSEYVRANAARALGEIHDEAASPDLIRTLTTEVSNGVIEQTALALEMLKARDAVPVLKVRAANTSGQTRIWILGAVEVLGSREDAAFFGDFLFDRDETVAWFAARDLEHLTGENFGFPRCGPSEQKTTLYSPPADIHAVLEKALGMPGVGGKLTKQN